jgi:hypothetical protein
LDPCLRLCCCCWYEKEDEGLVVLLLLLARCCAEPGLFESELEEDVEGDKDDCAVDWKDGGLKSAVISCIC